VLAGGVGPPGLGGEGGGASYPIDGFILLPIRV